MKQTILSMCALVVVLLFNSAVFADARFISSLKAKVFSEPNFKSSLIAQLTKGKQVEVVQAKGIWLKVAFDNQQGWVTKFLVKKTLPLDAVTVFDNTKKEVELKDVRRRTSAITTAAAARGLASVARDKDTKYKEDLAGLTYMESFKVSPKALKAFEKPLRGENNAH